MPIDKFRTFEGKRYKLVECESKRGDLDPLRENYMQQGYYVRIVRFVDGDALYVRKKPIVKRKASDARVIRGTQTKYIAGIRYRLEAVYRTKRSAKREANRLRNTGWRSVRVIELRNGWGVYKN